MGRWWKAVSQDGAVNGCHTKSKSESCSVSSALSKNCLNTKCSKLCIPTVGQQYCGSFNNTFGLLRSARRSGKGFVLNLKKKSTLMNMKSRIPCKKSCRLFKYRHQQLYFHVISHWLIGSLMLLLQPALCSGQHFLPTLASFCTFFFFESRCVFPARHQWALPVFWTMSLWFFSAGWGNPDSGLSGGSMSTERETLRLRQCVRRLSDVRWKTLAASSVWAGS